jgi:hypothetical protein
MTDDHERQGRHWDSVAPGWRLIAPPLRPSAPDLEVMQRAIERQSQLYPLQPLRGMLLGVTPEIATLAWPQPAELLAVDRSPEMVREVWPGDVPGFRRAVCGDWFTVLPEMGPLHVVIGDGTFSNVLFPGEAVSLTRLIHETLLPEGILVTRLFAEPEERETPADVFQALQTGGIGSFHVFKFRLAMALQPVPGGNVRVHDVWRAWAAAGIDEAELGSARGWALDVIRTIDRYRDSPVVFAFPTLRQMRSVWEEGFDVEATSIPAYEMGERCPTLVLRRRPG